MYPYITLGPLTLYMTGLGLLAGAIVFLWTTRWYAKKRQLPFGLFFSAFSLSVIIIYLFGTYTRYLIEDFVVFPIDRQYRVLYLSPFGYKFHFFGIAIGIMVSGRLFLKKTPPSTHRARISTLCHAFLMAMLPIGIGLVLGDNFIGQPVESGPYVSALLADSRVAAYDRVAPLGLYLALFGIVCHLILARKESTKKALFGERGWAAIFFWIGVLMLFQQYARHVVISMGGFAFDIKQYIAFGLALWWAYTARKKTNTRS